MSLGALVALTAAPAASLADASRSLASTPMKLAAQPTTTTYEVELMVGSTGRQVRLLQRALNIKVDGIFGPETEGAVRRLQEQRGLRVDGIVGPETWGALRQGSALEGVADVEANATLKVRHVKRTEPRHAAATRRARLSRFDAGGTEAGIAGDDDSRTPAAAAQPRLRQSPTGDSASPTGGSASPTGDSARPAGDHPARPAVDPARPAERPVRRPGAGGYVNPLPGGFAAGRTDMGVDFTAAPGAPILAIGDARILGIYPNWYPPGGPNGGNLLEYELLSGPSAGRKVYVAEQIEVTVHPGESVRAGAVIGRYASSGTGIETGWAAGGGVTLAQASTGYNEGEVTPAGTSFRDFLRSLGVSA